MSTENQTLQIILVILAPVVGLCVWLVKAQQKEQREWRDYVISASREQSEVNRAMVDHIREMGDFVKENTLAIQVIGRSVDSNSSVISQLAENHENLELFIKRMG